MAPKRDCHPTPVLAYAPKDITVLLVLITELSIDALQVGTAVAPDCIPVHAQIFAMKDITVPRDQLIPMKSNAVLFP